MANKLEKGLAYRAVRVRSGNSGRGPWELIVTKDERNKNDITIFPVNRPSNVVEGQQFKIIDIKCVSSGFRKDNKGVWTAAVSVDAEVEPIRSEFDDIPDAEFKGVDVEADDPWGNMDEVLGDLPY